MMIVKKWMAGVLAASVLVPTFGKSAEKERPNLLLIITDDLGTQLGCYGDHTIPTPNIDRLAKEGVLFSRAYVTAATCSPSRGSIFTGLFPHQHGMIGLSQQDWGIRFEHRIKDGIPLLPNTLKDLGYRTAIYGKRHYQPVSAFAWDEQVENQKHLIDRDVVLMADSVERFIGNPSSQPFFVVASYADPHRFGNVFTPFQKNGLPENPLQPGDAPPLSHIGADTSETRTDAAGYFNMIKRLDYGIGLLWAKLEKAGKLDNTLIIFVSDNGPDFIRAKKSVYEIGVRIPFLVRWPGRTQAGLVRNEFVSTVDLFSTFVSAATGELRPHGAGRPLQPLFQSGDVPWRDSMLSEFIVHAPSQYYPQYALSTERYQLIHNLDFHRRNPITIETKFSEWLAAQSPGKMNQKFRDAYARYDSPPEFELYDVQSDPDFLNNLANNPEYEQMLKNMQEKMHEGRVEMHDPLLDNTYRIMLTERYKEMTPYVPSK
jgi:N-sulfoglucosamine sulfohydrolase